VRNDRTGVCTFGAGTEEIGFKVDDLLDDPTLIELVSPPEWFGDMIPQWSGGLSEDAERESAPQNGTASA
jgi:hypothetical protein